MTKQQLLDKIASIKSSIAQEVGGSVMDFINELVALERDLVTINFVPKLNAKVRTGFNGVVEIDCDIKGQTVGRVVMRYEEINDPEYTIYYYPITEVTGQDGRTLLYSQRDK